MKNNKFCLNAAQAILVISILIFFAVYSINHYLAAGRDDTFIMLWAGQTLGHDFWFVNFNYETQEISSSIFGALIAALTKGMTVQHALLVIKLFGLIASLATLVLLWSQREAFFSGIYHKRLLALGTIVAIATSPSFQYWTLGGLETPYYALFLSAFCLLLTRSLSCNEDASGRIDWWLAVGGILLILTRAEGFWPIIMAGVFCIVIRRSIAVRNSTIKALFVSIVFLVVLMILRIKFTGALWPNPVYAKVGDYVSAVPAGARYIMDYYKTSLWGMIQGIAFLYGISAMFRFGLCALRRFPPGEFLILEAVIGATVLCQQVFIVLTGGNWMEYFRFEVAVIPLQNVLVFRMISAMSRNLPQIVVRKGILVSVFVLLSFTQIGRAGNLYAGNCAKPLGKEVWAAGIDGISQHLILGNCAHSRDWNAIKPFIDKKLPELLSESGGHLTVASYQAGFFPYFLRQKYSSNEIWFIDTMGLNDIAIARLPGRKSNTGHFDGTRIDLALAGKSGALSEFLEKQPPNMVYLLSADNDVRENFSALGYRVVWDEPGAVVFFRATSR